jgi:hypothetical protein
MMMISYLELLSRSSNTIPDPGTVSTLIITILVPEHDTAILGGTLDKR